MQPSPQLQLQKGLFLGIIISISVLITISLVISLGLNMLPSMPATLAQKNSLTPTNNSTPTNNVTSQVPSPTPTTFRQGKWLLTWADEFTSAANSKPDAKKWNVASNQSDGLGYATPRNVYLDGTGNLIIDIKKENPDNVRCGSGLCQYTAATLKTDKKFELTYGRVEAKVKLPQGLGIRSTFILRGNDEATKPWPANGSIGIIEALGKNPSEAYASLQGSGYSSSTGFYKTYRLPNSKFSDDFHIFAIEWSEDKVSYFIDGTNYYTVIKADVEKKGKWVFDHPFFLSLDISVGESWLEAPNGTTKFPQQIQIDYIRAFRSESGNN
jgi:beta-glucanase (GH16 family)